jgi:hypothetical protein
VKALLVWLSAVAVIGAGCYVIYPPAGLIAVGLLVLLDLYVR